MNLENITLSHFEYIHNAGYNLDCVYLLVQAEKGVDITEFRANPKLKVLHQTLVRKGLINADGLTLTLRGKELIKYIGEEEVEAAPIKKVKVPVSDFESWWKSYPGTDTFTHNGKKFIGSRTLRQNKDECKKKFSNIILEGEYTAEQLIEALKYDVQQKKEASIKEKRNKLTFMQNSLTYLNQRSFEAFIELMQNPIEPEQTIDSTDI